MKTKLIIILLASLLGCDQCEPDPPLTELEKLPPATQEGKNTFGCLVNGKAWVTKTSIDAAAFYQGGLLSISAGIDSPDESIQLNIGDRWIKNGATYLLDDPSLSTAEFFKRRNTQRCEYDFHATLSGEVTITNLDRTRYVVSGNFQFSAFLPSCDTINITDGRFDLTYAP